MRLRPLAVLPAVLALFPGCAIFGGSDGELDELVRLIEKHYVQDVGPDNLTGAARKGLFGALDPYSVYLDESDYKELRRQIGGEFGGIGVLLGIDSTTTTPWVKGTFLDSPARKAGVRAGDIILTVDGTPTTGRPIDALVGTIQGKVGSTVALGVRRAGLPEDLHFSVRRAVIQTGTVRGFRRLPSGAWDYLADEHSRVGYVRILGFAKRTPTELDSALAAVQRAGARALVLDLRSNPGGLMRSAVGVADRFLDSGTIVTVRHRGKSDEVHRAEPGVSTSIPMALLIDEGTASSAEILAFGLQDNGRAVVLGSRSFGKGVGQQIYDLKGGRRGLKLTTFAYIRPSGRPMERHLGGSDSTLAGVWPDSGMAVALEPEELERWAQATYATDDLLMLAEAPPDTAPPVVDRVLERAVEVLGGTASR